MCKIFPSSLSLFAEAAWLPGIPIVFGCPLGLVQTLATKSGHPKALRVLFLSVAYSAFIIPFEFVLEKELGFFVVVLKKLK